MLSESEIKYFALVVKQKIFEDFLTCKIAGLVTELEDFYTHMQTDLLDTVPDDLFDSDPTLNKLIAGYLVVYDISSEFNICTLDVISPLTATGYIMKYIDHIISSIPADSRKYVHYIRSFNPTGRELQKAMNSAIDTFRFSTSDSDSDSDISTEEIHRDFKTDADSLYEIYSTLRNFHKNSSSQTLFSVGKN